MFRSPSILSAIFLIATSLATPGLAAENLNRGQIVSLLSGKTEQGMVNQPSSDDIGPVGTRYSIMYSEDGSLRYSTSQGRSGSGNWSFSGDALCRSFDGMSSSCRNIEKTTSGYQGVGFRTGTLRYTFTVRDAAENLNRGQIVSLLSGKTEQGMVNQPSSDDIGPIGTRYAIVYSEDGSLRYSTSQGRSGSGNWSFSGDALCRSFDGMSSSCRNIEKTTSGYQGVGFRTGTLRYTFTVRDEDPILHPIGQFLETRAAALLNNQPDLSSFLKPDENTPGNSGGFTFQATDGHLALDGGFVRDGVWGEVSGSYASGESGDTKSVLGSFGIHRKYSDRFLAGVMLQFDLADHDLNRQAGTIDGTGWLAGPYFAARHDTRPLYFEGRLLYGQSDNDIRFIDPALGARTGSFDTKRLLAQVRMEGEIALSDRDEGPRLIPYADARWIEDRATAFTTVSATGFSVPVPGQKVSIGQLELGSNVEVPIAVSEGSMILTGGLGLVYSNTESDYIGSESRSRSRGRGEIGFSYDLDDNVRIDLESFYDGIGTSGYEGYGLSLSAEMKF